MTDNLFTITAMRYGSERAASLATFFWWSRLTCCLLLLPLPTQRDVEGYSYWKLNTEICSFGPKESNVFSSLNPNWNQYTMQV